MRSKEFAMTFSEFVMLALAASAVGPAYAQSDADRYSEAQRALNRQEFDEAIAALRALRRDYPESRYIDDSYYWEAFALERSGNPERALDVIDTLLSEHAESESIDDAQALRIQICSELARRGDADCAAQISSTVRDLDQVGDLTRSQAVNALINMRPERAVPIATQLLANRNQSIAIRRQALFILADKADDEAVAAQVRETLLSTALDTTDNLEVRTQAVFWLSEVEGEESLDALARLLDVKGPKELTNAALFAISEHESPRAGELLRQFAQDDARDIELRKQAVFWIGERAEDGDTQALPFLMNLYGNVTNTELKRQLLFAVAETESPGSQVWLLERANEAGAPLEVRKQALFWASEAGLPIDDLSSLYRTTTEPELREHLIWLISEHDSEGSLDLLLEIARSDPDPAMREKAIFWIGDSEDPRAEAFLLELIGQ
jgi:outer membrane lipoprotein YfiO/HEAT repeat protein